MIKFCEKNDDDGTRVNEFEGYEWKKKKKNTPIRATHIAFKNWKQ